MVRFRAIPMTMRALVWSILGIVTAAGVLVAVLLIAVSDILQVGARLTIIIVGVGIALPVSLAFSALLRRRTRDCTVAFGAYELRITAGTDEISFPYRELEHLRWRCDSEYARVEARGAEIDISLIVGIAKPPVGTARGLPPLPRRVYGLLDAAGLAMTRTRRGEVVTFERGASQPSG